MPLEASSANKVRSENIREMVKAGFPQRRAIAAAYRVQRKAKRNRRK